MAARALRCLAACATLAGPGWYVAASSDNEALQQRIEQMRELLKAEDSKLNRLERTERRRGRRLASTVPSIHGAYDANHRAYTSLENYQGALNHFWLLICGALVMFMQAGFAMVESGCCRAKNVQSILLKNVTDVAVGTIGWYFLGWSFAYSGPVTASGYKENRFAGGEEFAGHTFVMDIRENGQLEPSAKMASWFFQWTFCATAATIVSGGVAERVNFPGYTIFSFCMTSFIYPIIVAWTWGYGFLADMNDTGYIDFAGSGVVHLTGGVAALVGAIIARPRIGRFPEDWDLKKRVMETPAEFDPHSQPLIVMGTFSLWFGWYGFNCGSTLSMESIEKGFLAAHVAVNTTLSAAMGGLTVFAIRYAIWRKYDIGGMCNGILAGLVAITAGCSNLDNGTAAFVGFAGGCIFQGASMGVKAAKVDDPIDAFAVHGSCGIWGVLAAALFDWGNGFDHGHGWNGFKCHGAAGSRCGVADSNNYGGQLFVANLCEILVIVVWSGGLSAMIFFFLRKVQLLRPTEEMEKSGLDMKHSPTRAYASDPVPPMDEEEEDEPLDSI